MRFTKVMPRLVLAGILATQGACAARSTAQRTSTSVPASVQSIFVENFRGSQFGPEMREAIQTALQATSRFRVVDDPRAADAYVSGSFGLGSTTRMTEQVPPTGFIMLTLSGSDRVIWQYQYRDQQSGAEMVQPTATQQVRNVARQFVAQLVRVSDLASAAPPN